ncbi:MAG: DUF92 domain-containing protein [Candidatus Hodarchaeota archaeon]
MFLIQLGISLIINGLGVAIATLKKHLKFPSGSLAALIVGISLFTFSFYSWILLMTFFISSSLLTRFKSQLKVNIQDKFDKGGERDADQVFANSGPTVVYAVLISLLSIPELSSPFFIAITAYFASVNADTFSTEIGILAKPPPRWILDPRRSVEKGTSGGITLLGTLAGAFGALEIGFLLFIGTLIFPEPNLTPEKLGIALGIVLVAGICGNFIDSLLGATVQGFYFCPTCQIGTEKRIHLKCGGSKTRLTRGWNKITNDWVNFLAATSASIIAFILAFSLT